MNNYPIFVYGTLMHDERAFGLLAADSLHYGKAQLPGALLYASPNGYPIAVASIGARIVTPATVLGELHWLRPATYQQLLNQLDQYEGDEYIRQLCSVELVAPMPSAEANAEPMHSSSFADASACKMKAWVYLGDAAYAAQYPRIIDGDWRKRSTYVDH